MALRIIQARSSLLLACLALPIATGCAGLGRLVGKSGAHDFDDGMIVEHKIDLSDPPKSKPTPRLLTDFGHYYASVGNHERARELFEQALAIDDHWESAYVGLARVDVAQRHYDRALRSLEQGIEKQPDSALIWNQVSLVHVARNDYRRAITAMERAVAASPDSELYRVNLAGMLAAAGRYDESSRLYASQLSTAEAHYRVANIALGAGAEQAGRRQLELALRADPAHEGARRIARQIETNSTRPANYVGRSAENQVELSGWSSSSTAPRVIRP